MPDNLTVRESKVVDAIEQLRSDILAIQQPRSNYQLEKFVVGAHDMPGRQRMQALLELQVKLFTIRRDQLSLKKLEIEIAQLDEKMKSEEGAAADLIQIEIEQLKLNRAEKELHRMGSVREAETLLEILHLLPSYTREQLQAEEEEYWRRRLQRQASEDLAATGRISVGNLDALVQSGRTIGKAPDGAEVDKIISPSPPYNPSGGIAQERSGRK